MHRTDGEGDTVLIHTIPFLIMSPSIPDVMTEELVYNGSWSVFAGKTIWKTHVLRL